MRLSVLTTLHLAESSIASSSRRILSAPVPRVVASRLSRVQVRHLASPAPLPTAQKLSDIPSPSSTTSSSSTPSSSSSQAPPPRFINARDVFDIVIIGAGNAGLALVCALLAKPSLRDSRILLLEGGSLDRVRNWTGQGEWENRVSSLTAENVDWLRGGSCRLRRGRGVEGSSLMGYNARCRRMGAHRAGAQLSRPRNAGALAAA
ncbi:hypothetical protein P7C73_g6748, partial [Tremellales sp. Uapishka_1]